MLIQRRYEFFPEFKFHVPSINTTPSEVCARNPGNQEFTW